MPRRTIYLALIAIFLGAITTVFTAWLIAANRANGSSSIPSDRWGFSARDGVIYWGANSFASGHSIVAVESQDPVQYQQWRDQASKPHRQLTEFEPVHWVTVPISDPGYLYVSNAFGWPMLALRGLVVEGPLTPTRQMTVFKDYWIFGHPDDPRTIALPLGIIWPGFLINTLTYTLAWFVLLFAAHRAARALFTRRRLRRGTCPHCRYDLLGDFSSGCPECGWNRITTQPS